MFSRSQTLAIIVLLSAVTATPQPFRSLSLNPVLVSRAQEGHPPGFSYLGYSPNYPVNAVGAVVFGAIGLGLTFRQVKLRAGYMLAMIIGVWFYLTGIIIRFPLSNNPDSLSIFLVQNLAIILSPCAFIASVYAILGQIALRQEADDCLPIPPTKIAKTFIWSDVITFLIQAGGGAIEVQENLSDLGSKIFLAGLILQLVSFFIFCSFFVIFVVRVRARHPKTFADRSWHPLACALAVSCVGIIIRSIFRTIENSQGHHGYLSVHEGYFWALDALPLAIATSVFIPFWPELYLPKYSTLRHAVALHSIEIR